MCQTLDKTLGDRLRDQREHDRHRACHRQHPLHGRDAIGQQYKGSRGLSGIIKLDPSAPYFVQSRTLGVQVVVTDHSMPGKMNGSELAVWIKAHRPEIKTVLASSHNGLDGADAFLAKPVSVERLDRIRCCLSEQAQVVSSPVATVLVGEGDVLVRLALAQYLRECGYKVLKANTTDEALTIMKSPDVDVDVLVCAVDLGGTIDGFSLSQWVRTNTRQTKGGVGGQRCGRGECSRRTVREGANDEEAL
jgi:CheY-like chemotaxis protein